MKKRSAKAIEKAIEKKKDDRTGFYKFMYAWCAPLFRFLFRVKVIGLENEPVEGGFLVCANHLSALDPIVISASMRRHQIRYMAKKELFRIPVLSWLIKGLGAYPVDRAGGNVGAIKNAISLLTEGKCAGIFPQGTRNAGKNPRDTKVKNGAAMIAVRAESDILPVHIYYKKYRPRLFRRTVVVIGKPIPFSQLGYDPEKSGEYARISEEIFDVICRLGEECEECRK